MTDDHDEEASRPPSGLDIALEWAQLPSEHLETALKALEPQLAREHEYRMARLAAEREARTQEKRLKSQERTARNNHVLYLSGLIAGFILSAGALTGAVVVGVNDQPWLAAMLSGPSVIALATLFVLRRSDSAQTRAVTRAHRAAVNAAERMQTPAVETADSVAGGGA